ncbi:MAG: TonB-dependent receptor [Sphingobacteriales bacterium]|nr:MAG: TonB-dependent receptor [Sphingobacteriales bacterium]
MRKLFVVAALIPCSPLLAQQAADSTKTLDEVVVSATKSSIKSSATGKVVIVIDRAAIERSGTRDIAQVLSEQGGLFINGASSNAGKDKSVYVRGARVEHTLITIDGVPVYDPSGIGSNFDLRLVPIETVERIEVLKGSQGTLYGSDAIAGVINIITRKAGKEKAQGSILASYGSFNTFNGSAQVNGTVKSFDYNVSATLLDSKSISEAATPEGAKDYARNPYRQQSGNLALGYRVSPKVHLQAYLRYTEAKGNLDAGYYADALDYTYANRNIQPGLRANFTLGKGTLRALYNYNSNDRQYQDDSTLTPNLYSTYDSSRYRSKEHYAEVYYSLPASKQVTFTVGGDYRRSKTDIVTLSLPDWTGGDGRSILSGDSVHHRQVAVYGNVLWNGPAGLGLEVGGRFNSHSRYGSAFSYNINPSYLWNKTVKLFANISTGYRTPSLYQLYSEYGNRDLNPEKSLNLEGGLQLLSVDGGAAIRATYFNREVRDLMVFFTEPVTFRSYYINRDRQKDHGIELDARAALGEHFSLKLFYTYADGEVTTKMGGKDTTIFNLYRRPKESFALTLGAKFGRFTSSAQLMAQGKVPEQYFDNNTFSVVSVNLHSYTLVNLYAEYALKTPGLRLFADLRNITGERYMEAYGYNTPRFNGYGGIRYNF